MLNLKSKDRNIWFMSDSHYYHKNITYGESVWNNKETGCRRFDTTQEMSSYIVDQINKYIKQDDLVFFLGDWSFGGINNIWNFYNRLVCKNIHFILGNHDHHIKENKILPNCRYDNYYNIISYQEGIFNPNSVRAKDLFLSVQYYLEVVIDEILVCLMHYPLEEWNNRHRQSYHLFGHVHGRLSHGNGRLDVGFDNAFKLFGEYKPFSWEDINRLLKTNSYKND